MSERFARNELILGQSGVEKLASSRVIVFGVGGVGGYVCEGLARAGVGSIDLVDNDVVSESNINRQIIATTGTIGRGKCDVMRERILAINPDCKVTAHQMFYLPETANAIDLSKYDYIVDAVDTVTAKLEIIVRASEVNVPIMSSMGTGNHLDGTSFKVSDIYKTSVCPLAKVMRRELKKRGIKKLKVVYSTELPVNAVADSENGRHAPGSIPWTPGIAGLIIASEVVRDLAKR